MIHITITDSDFQRLRSYMYNNFGLNLEKKRALVEGRLGSSIVAAGFDNMHDYIEDVLGDKSGAKANELITKLTTNYTYFLREEQHYQFMTKTALPEWTQKIKNHDLRIWSAGCSSGEEPYTTAMVLSEYFGVGRRSWDTTVLATDISPRVLASAKRGVYQLESLERLPPAWKSRYFVSGPQPDEVAVSDALKKEVVFASFNLMDNFTRFKKKFHIIFCRNVMIYFDNPTKAALTQRFYDVLEPGGYFFIGMSETLSGINNSFQQISPAIYRKG